MIRKSKNKNLTEDRKIKHNRGGDPRGPPGPQPPLLFLIFLSFVWFIFLDFLIILFDFVDFLIDVHGLGDVRERGFGPVKVPAGSGSVRFRFSRFIFFARFGRVGSKTVRFPVLGSVRGLPVR